MAYSRRGEGACAVRSSPEWSRKMGIRPSKTDATGTLIIGLLRRSANALIARLGKCIMIKSTAI